MKRPGQSPLDPEEAVRRTTRRPRRKRFYTQAGVVEAPGGFAITLDGKPVRTPSGRALVAPTREIAERIAAEWEAQQEFIDPLTMPMTRFANSVVDGVVDGSTRSPTTSQNISAPICCSIAPAIRRRWWRGKPRFGTRSLFWAAETLGAHFILAEGIVHVAPARCRDRGGARGVARRIPGRSRRCMWSRH